MRKARDARDEAFSRDHVHPGDEGHLLMARTILAALGIATPDETVSKIKTDPLYALVEQKRTLRSDGWMKHIGYTRERVVAPQALGNTESDSAAIQTKIDALPGAGAWTPLFNGKDLAGWTVKCLAADRGKSFWRVEDGTILCDSIGRKDHNYVWLLSDEEFADFELRLKFQAYADSPGNSGLQFRSRYEEQADGGWLHGPQVDIHPPRAMSWRTGLIYDETREERRWVYPSLPSSAMPPELKPAQHVFRYADEGWNELELVCRGTRVITRVNGIVRTDWQAAGVLDNAAHQRHNVGRSGHFALQLHSGDELRIRYKDIEVRRLPAVETPRIPAVSAAMSTGVARREIAGAVTLVATPDDIVHLEATGLADLAGGTPMAPDSIFWIASMTKPVTAVAVLMLEEEGKLSVDDPVSKYLPEIGSLKLPDGQPAAITLKHLLTHTAGMPEATPEQYRTARTLAEVIPFYAGRTVAFPPGTKWQYCQSGINSLGRVVEVVSGESFAGFLAKRIFGPLGMKDTGFYLTDAQLPRLAKAYARTDDALHEVPITFLGGHAPTFRERYAAPNGGLFSTAPDYARFCRMLLNRGSLDGRRLLKPETVARLATIQTGDLPTGFTAGNGWGLGFCVVREPQGVTAALSPGSFGHGGAFGTQAWVDPVRKVVYVLMVQRSNFRNSDASDVRREFQAAAAAAGH
jgi:CubicO group peptidase (beta-lactamase class C family)